MNYFEIYSKRNVTKHEAILFTKIKSKIKVEKTLCEYYSEQELLQ